MIDALGWEIVEHFKFCESLLAERVALDTVLGYSSAAIPSLLSGCPPSEHGAWSMYRLADKRSPFWYARYLPGLPHALEWRARRAIRWITDKRAGIDGYYDLYDVPLSQLGRFDVAHYGDPYEPGGMSRQTIFDGLVEADVPYRLWYYKTPEAHNMSRLLSAVADDEYDLLFLYTADLDALMHRVGIFDASVGEHLDSYQRFIEEVFLCGKNSGRDVSLYVVSDHGMTDVHTAVDLWGEMERRGLKLGKHYVAFYDSTMARFWCDEHVRSAAADILGTDGAGRLLSDGELEERGCLFSDRAYGETIFLASPGVMIVPSFMGRVKIAAMHGYDPDDIFSKGCFLTNDRSGTPPSSILDFKSYLLERVPGDDR